MRKATVSFFTHREALRRTSLDLFLASLERSRRRFGTEVAVDVGCRQQLASCRWHCSTLARSKQERTLSSMRCWPRPGRTAHFSRAHIVKRTSFYAQTRKLCVKSHREPRVDIDQCTTNPFSDSQAEPMFRVSFSIPSSVVDLVRLLGGTDRRRAVTFAVREASTARRRARLVGLLLVMTVESVQATEGPVAELAAVLCAFLSVKLDFDWAREAHLACRRVQVLMTTLIVRASECLAASRKVADEGSFALVSS